MSHCWKKSTKGLSLDHSPLGGFGGWGGGCRGALPQGLWSLPDQFGDTFYHSVSLDTDQHGARIKCRCGEEQSGAARPRTASGRASHKGREDPSDTTTLYRRRL